MPWRFYRAGEYHTIKANWNNESASVKHFLTKKYGPDVYILNEHV